MQEHTFKKGDLISVIDDAIKGKIIAIHGNRITIEDEFGFPGYYNVNQVILHKPLEEILSDKVLVKDKIHEKPKKKKRTTSSTVLEVDLHIHQITNTNRNMSKHDMLQYQVTFAKQKMQQAIKNKISKIIFIHGNGKGVLRQEVEKMLAQFPVEIKDASYQKYGFGAVEVKIFLSKISN